MTREQAIEHGKEQLEIFGGEHREFIKMAIKALEQEPKTGHWIDCDNSDDYSADGYDCSVCGVNAEYVTSYCPNCGAKMAETEAEDGNADQ